MTAVSRWIEYPVNPDSKKAPRIYDGGNSGVGRRAYSRSTSTSTDKFTITAGVNDQITVNLGSGAREMTLISGTNIDGRILARYIQEQVHKDAETAGMPDAYKMFQCEFITDHNQGGSFYAWSGQLGGGSCSIGAGTNDARATLGWDTASEVGGDGNKTYTGSPNGGSVDITVSGTYYGQFDDVYTLVISDTATISGVTAVPGGGNTYNGTVSVGGFWNSTLDTTYIITVTTSGTGYTVDGGSGNVPTFTVAADGISDSNSNPVEILHANTWYPVGNVAATRGEGLFVKWDDDVPFGNGDTWTIECLAPTGGNKSSDGAAKMVISSRRGDNDWTPRATGISQQSIGVKGVTVAFDNGTLFEGNEYHVICRGPQPTSWGVSNLNFGNVTVSTESAIKVVLFELMSGAESMSTVKFGLNSHGTFSHHDQGNYDTMFRFGTCGAGQSRGGTPDYEWYSGVDANELSADSQPSTHLHRTVADMPVVASADQSYSIGNYQGGLTSDLIWLGIKLGASETGSNSTIAYRMYFDYA